MQNNTEKTTDEYILVEMYIASLDENKMKAYIIARDLLETSFDVQKSNGFIIFKAALDNPKP